MLAPIGGGLGLSGHQIYEALTSGPGTAGLEDAYGVADAEAQLEAQRAELIKRLATKIEAGWEGEAGAAAHSAARPLADVSLIGAENLERTHVLLQQHADVFGSVAAAVYPVPANPPESNLYDDLTPWDTDTEDAQRKYAAESEHNIRLFEVYDNESMANEQALPMDYSTLSDTGDVIVVEKPGPGIEPPQPPPHDPVEPVGRGGGEDQGRGWTPPQPPPGIVGPPPGLVDPPPVGPPDDQRTPPQITTPNEWVAPPPSTPNPARPPVPMPVGLPTADPLLPVGGGYGPGGSGSGSRGGAGGFGARGGGAGEHGAGARGGAAEHGPGSRSGATEHGPGGRPGSVGAGEHATGRPGGATAGARGAGGAGGGMGGGGRGQGGEDEEHTRASFLLEDDPEAVFGTDQVTAPPVIGE